MSNEEMKENEQKPAHPHRLRKSARPRPITYVPMDEEEFAPLEMKENEQKPAHPHRLRKSARPRPITYVPMDEEEFAPFEPPVKKKHKGLKIAGIAAGMLFAVAGTVYAGITYYYSDKFFEGTTINGIDVSGKTAFEVEQTLAGKVEDYTLQVAARNMEPQQIAGNRIGYKYISDGEVLALLRRQKPYEWIRCFWEKDSFKVEENSTFDREKLKSEVKGLNCAKEENQVAPEDAYVAFAETQFEIVPETEGTQLEMRQAYNALVQAVSESRDNIDFAQMPEVYKKAAVTQEIVPETEGTQLEMRQAYNALVQAVSESRDNIDFAQMPEVYKKAAVTQESPELIAAKDACNNFTKASITYTFGEETVTLDGNTIKNWLSFDEKGRKGTVYPGRCFFPAAYHGLCGAACCRA